VGHLAQEIADVTIYCVRICDVIGADMARELNTLVHMHTNTLGPVTVETAAPQPLVDSNNCISTRDNLDTYEANSNRQPHIDRAPMLVDRNHIEQPQFLTDGVVLWSLSCIFIGVMATFCVNELYFS
jgi:hypothetical protein